MGKESILDQRELCSEYYSAPHFSNSLCCSEERLKLRLSFCFKDNFHTYTHTLRKKPHNFASIFVGITEDYKDA